MREILPLIIQEQERKKQEQKFDQLPLYIEAPSFVQEEQKEKSSQPIIIIDVL